MSQLLDNLKALDQKMLELFQQNEVDSEKILSCIDEREQILQEINSEFKSVPGFESSQEWQDAIIRTKQLVKLLQTESNQLGEQLKKYRHGNKSVQRYQQFL
ncbi:flagellar protein FliT [Vibrio algarum]|uniref:Flagellar protein FliT n=1 Tax=Vibrio algarum TaxID=3020714 RepID=A0ABT4YP05_9VIBR|nr:flagellar protein FliT [Vibrio sp. KJ40-1]MDB1123293.1 flagellar protein FliT [Vibrio sp. KJ40-1]